MACRRRNQSLSLLDLPEDVLLPIFSTLPITTILRCRRVSKSWYLFLSSPNFADFYRKNAPFTSLIVSNGKHFSFLELNAGDHNYSMKPNNPKILPNPFGSSSSSNEETRLVGSCNGFLCFNQNNKVNVSNPLTGTSLNLPNTGFGKFNLLYISSYGFGFCPKTKQYKVIEIVEIYPEIPFTQIHVLTVGIDKNWRRVLQEDVPFPKRYDITQPSIQFCEVNGKGILYWIAQKMDRDDYLYCFDITDENVQSIPPPVGLQETNLYTTSVFLNGCFCILHKNKEYNMEIWCMENYMDPKSWTVRIVSLSGLPGHIRFGLFNPVAVWRNKEILMTKKPDSIVSCNEEQRIFTKLMLGKNTLPKYYAASCFVPNFESVLRARTQDGIMKLPNYLLVEIFSRLPVKTIVSCKSVCKSWCRFLSDPCFAESYYRFKRVVHLALCDETSFLFLLKLNTDTECCSKTVFRLDTNVLPKSTVLGSCNGLICFSVFSDVNRACKLCICNPLMQQLVFLVESDKVIGLQDDAYGFGFSPLTGDYKILRIFTRQWNERKSNAEARVYTIGIDQGWRRTEGSRNFRMPKSRFCDAAYNRAIHWIAEDSNGRNLIYAFGIDDEQVKSLLLPPNMEEDINGYTCLVVLRDCLCVFHPQTANVVVIWSLKTYDLVTSWSKEMISLNSMSRPVPDIQVVLPVMSWRKDGDMFFRVGGNGTSLILYCLKEKRCSEIKIDDVDNEGLVAVPYMPSFLSLKTVARYGHHLEITEVVD